MPDYRSMRLLQEKLIVRVQFMVPKVIRRFWERRTAPLLIEEGQHFTHERCKLFREMPPP